MSGRLFSSDIFSSDRKPVAAHSDSYADRYSPYADAWKDFDKLQKTVKNGGAPRLVRAALEFLIFGGGAFGLHHISKRYSFLILGPWAGLVIVDLLRWPHLKNRFTHWPCPRCHSEWPGTKTEKDSACKICGLRLHQLSP